MEYIPFEDEPTPIWLTAVLRQAGILSAGEVVAVEHRVTSAFNSSTCFLRVRYSSEAPSSAPKRLVLKRNLPDAWAIAAGIDEVRFYHLVAALGDHPSILPPCYAAAYEASSGNSYILLEDLSATHAPPVTREEQIRVDRGVPSAHHQWAVVETLASLHAYWWEHAYLNSGVMEAGFWSRDEERFNQYLVKRKAAWKKLMATESSWFPVALRALFDRLFAQLPGFWKTHLAPRFQSYKHVTLIHGDAYFANFLCPKDAGAEATYLLDWQSPSFDLAAYDLVNLLATFWTRTQRKAQNREATLLRHYYTGLLSGGVQGYRWEELLADYRVGLIFWVLMPIQDGADGAAKEYWWPKLCCLLDAFEDWNCANLLGEHAEHY